MLLNSRCFLGKHDNSHNYICNEISKIHKHNYATGDEITELTLLAAIHNLSQQVTFQFVSEDIIHVVTSTV